MGASKAGYSEPEAQRPMEVERGPSSALRVAAETIKTTHPVRHPECSDILAFGCYRKRKAPGAP